MEENKNYNFLNIAAAISVSGLIYLGNFVSPVISLISAEFPEVSTSVIKMLTTIPSLMMVVMALVSGGLTSRYPIKKIVIVASLFSLVGGLMPVLIPGFTALLISRFIFGIGHGLIFPMASAIINQLFTGKQRDKIMGIRAGIGALIGSAYATVAGIMGAMGWRASLACTAVVIPLALFIAWKCPENELAKRAPAADAGAVKEQRLTTKTYIICGLLFIYNMLMVTFMTNLSLVVAKDGLGTTAQAGTISSTYTMAACVAGLIFGTVKGKVGRYISPLAFGLVGIGFVVLYFAPSITLFYVGAILYGIGFGFYNPALTMVAAQTAAQPKYAPIAISLYTSCVGLGQFLASIILPVVAGVFGLTGNRTDWAIAMVGCLIFAVGAALYIASSSKKKA